MQPTCTLVDPMPRHGSGVFREYGGLIHIALFEAHALAVLEIDGGNEQHGRGRGGGGREGRGAPSQGFQWRKLR
eukprot:2875-Eustigmatos_ZCMA.PRE.1